MRQADPGGNNGTVSGLSSEIFLHCHALGRKVLDGVRGPGLGHAAGGGGNGGAVPEATMRAAHPSAIARWELTRRWLALPGCPVKSQGVLCIGRAQEKARYRPGGQINRFVKIDGG